MGVWVLDDSSIVEYNKSLLKGQNLVGCQQCRTGNLRIMVMPGRLAVAMHKNPSSPKPNETVSDKAQQDFHSSYHAYSDSDISSSSPSSYLTCRGAHLSDESSHSCELKISLRLECVRGTDILGKA